MEVSKEDRAGLFSVILGERAGSNSHRLKGKMFYLNHLKKEKSFYCAGD